MTPRLILLGFLASAAAAATPVPGGGRGYWLEVTPEGADETALRGCFTKDAFGGPAAAADCLRHLADERPGTTVSGLAHVSAGLLLLEAKRPPADAIAQLRHPDVARTALADHALSGLGRALEAANDRADAARTFLAAAEARPDSPFVCPTLFRAADAFTELRQFDPAIQTLNRALTACPDQAARALLATARVQEARGNARAAAESYDRLDREHPVSPQAKEASPRLRALASLLPPSPRDARAARDLAKAVALADAGHHPEAVTLFRSVAPSLEGPDADLAHLRLGHSLLQVGRQKEAEAQLAAVTAGSPHEAEAAFHLAKIKARRQGDVSPYESVAARFPDSPWGEEALLTLANHFQKDARDDDALPYYRRLLNGYPDGRYVERATLRVGWGAFRLGHFEEAAQTFERTVRVRPQSTTASTFLYWAGRSRAEVGESDRARQLLEEAVRRFKYTYHGLRARETLARLATMAAAPTPAMGAAASDPQPEVPEPQRTRVRQLELIDRPDEAIDELRTLPDNRAAIATIGWIEWKRGRLRPAIIAMKQAYPEYRGEAGDLIPDAVWRILYPLEFAAVLQTKAAEEGLDAALVASLVCQESTFDAAAISRAGARGLMQVVPVTGRLLARSLGVPYRRESLHDPVVSLNFGTHYLRQMLDRYGGRIERALAAYNAGPHRVDAWTALRPDVSAEEFIESIPFTETRNYVMIILAGQEQYRRIYGLPTPASATTAEARP